MKLSDRVEERVDERMSHCASISCCFYQQCGGGDGGGMAASGIDPWFNSWQHEEFHLGKVLRAIGSPKRFQEFTLKSWQVFFLFLFFLFLS